MNTTHLRKVFSAVILTFSMLLTSCFEHDSPFTEHPNRLPDDKFIGIWKADNLPHYYSIQKDGPQHLKITVLDFDLHHPSLMLKREEIRAFPFTLEDLNILVSQKVSRSDSETYDVGKWGYFAYQIFGFNPRARTFIDHGP